MMVSDILDINLLKGHRDALQNNLDELSFVFEHFQSIKENIAVEEQKIGIVEVQRQDLMQRFSARITEIDNQKYEVASNKSSSSSMHSSYRRSSKNLIFPKFLIFLPEKLP